VSMYANFSFLNSVQFPPLYSGFKCGVSSPHVMRSMLVAEPRGTVAVSHRNGLFTSKYCQSALILVIQPSMQYSMRLVIA